MTFFKDLLDGRVRLWIAFWIVHFLNSKTITAIAFVLMGGAMWFIAVPYLLFSIWVVCESADTYQGPSICAKAAKIAAYLSLGLLLSKPFLRNII